VPVALDLGAVGHVEAHAGEDLLDALQRQLTGCRPPGSRTRPGQRDVQRLGLQLRFEFGVGQRLAPLGQRRLDRLLGLVDGGAARLLLLDGERGQALHQLGDAAGLADVLRLGVFQVGRAWARLREGGRRAAATMESRFLVMGMKKNRG
jgi:hypothetical protein